MSESERSCPTQLYELVEIVGRGESRSQTVTRVTLALVAHDPYKDALGQFVLDRRAEFSPFHRGEKTDNRYQKSAIGVIPDFFCLISDYVCEPDFASLLITCVQREITPATNPASVQALTYFLLNSPKPGCSPHSPREAASARYCEEHPNGGACFTH
jgi:methylglyoxal synthase